MNKEYIVKEDSYKIKISGQDMVLKYQERHYTKINGDIKQEIKNIKSTGGKIKYFNKVPYELVSVIKTPLYEKKLILSFVLQLCDALGESKLDEINRKWSESNWNKTKTEELMDKEAILLDTLASYYLGGYEGDNILNLQTMRKIQKYEVCDFGDFSEDIENNTKWEIRHTNHNRRRRFEDRNKKQIKRWRKSHTFKLNTLWDKHHDNLSYVSRVTNSKWCYVDSENKFVFDNAMYKILETVPQYCVDSDNQCVMDQILVINNNGCISFYDQNLKYLNEKDILKI